MKRETGLGIGLIVLLIAVLYGWTMVSASGGRPVAPLDDAYIHFQYARQIARGHLWQYNDGDPRSTGATSPLYPFLLAAGYRLGFKGENLVWFALGVGSLSLVASAWLIYRITGRLSSRSLDREIWVDRWIPWGTVVVFLLTGAIQWTYLSGMESGLFAAFALAALNAFLAGSASPNKRLLAQVTFWIALAALTRPGGLILVGVLWPVVVARSWRRKKSNDWQTQALIVAKRTWPIILAVWACLLPFLLNLALTGSAVATGAQAKSWFGNVPFRFRDILSSIFENYGRIIEQFAAGLLAQDPWPLAPGLLALAGIGWIALLRRQRWATFTLTLGWFALGALATASLITATWQVGRYQVPFLALLTPLAGLGFAALINGLPRRWQRSSAVFLAMGLLATTLASSLQARSTYQQTIRTVTEQHLVLADWIRDNLPPDARVGVHDTGAIRYVGQRPTYDMIGLTTQSAATAWRHGAGAVFERMERSPARPDHFATYPDVFSLPYLAATDLFAVELFRAEVSDFVVASAGPMQAVYRADWRLADSGNRLYQADVLRRTEGLTLLDRLDLADLEDEAAHDLSFWEGTVRSGFPTEVQQYRYHTDATIEVLDGGRLVNGGLAFRVAVQPGQPAVLTARLHPAQAGGVRVIIDDRDLGLWRYPAHPGAWLETAFFIPAAALTRDRPEIRLEVETEDPDFRHFALYHLWVWGGKPLPFVPSPTHPLSARLGDVVELVGFDQSASQRDNRPTGYQPGETIQLVLYWRAVAKPTDDAKVFVHLYNQEGEIVTQQDQRPYLGTRPPLTWSPDEALDDPYTLVLPSDLPPGRYTLGVGMYDAATGARLPVSVAAEHQLSDNRILLGTFEVVSGMEAP